MITASVPAAIAGAMLITAVPAGASQAAVPGVTQLRNLGWSVAISGTTLVAGAPSVNRNRGIVQIFVRSGRSWHHQATLADPAALIQANFGWSVAVSSTSAGTLALIGAPAPGAAQGTAFLYRRSGGAWHLAATLADPPGQFNDQFGSSVALTSTPAGRLAAVGALGTKNITGAAYIYGESGGKWQRLASFADPRGKAADAFGSSVAVSGTTAVVGAPGGSHGRVGHAYVYLRSGRAWRRRADLADPLAQASGLFGLSVAAAGSTVAVGSPGTNGAVERAYAYARSAGTWRRQAVLRSPPEKQPGQFGWAVTISATRLIVTAPGGALSQCGASYEYRLSAGAWKEQAKIINPDCKTTHNFGYSAALAAQTAAIGAPGAPGAVYVLAVP